MKDDAKHARHTAISNAAYALLQEKGYASTSMLNIAKAAKASNETLYRWYGSKQGLFAQMVRDNAEESRALLQTALKGGDDPWEALQRVAPVLLAMLLGDRAILLNRAAAADASGELGAALAEGGRAVIAPLIEQLVAGLQEVPLAQSNALTQCFLSLLIGDQQIRRVIATMDAPTPAQIEARVTRALEQFKAVLDAT